MSRLLSTTASPSPLRTMCTALDAQGAPARQAWPSRSLSVSTTSHVLVSSEGLVQQDSVGRKGQAGGMLANQAWPLRCLWVSTTSYVLVSPEGLVQQDSKDSRGLGGMLARQAWPSRGLWLSTQSHEYCYAFSRLGLQQQQQYKLGPGLVWAAALLWRTLCT
jgi:hypothetical protein